MTVSVKKTANNIFSKTKKYQNSDLTSFCQIFMPALQKAMTDYFGKNAKVYTVDNVEGALSFTSVLFAVEVEKNGHTATQPILVVNDSGQMLITLEDRGISNSKRYSALSKDDLKEFIFRLNGRLNSKITAKTTIFQSKSAPK